MSTAFKWIDASGSKAVGKMLWVGGCLVAMIQRPRGRGEVWHGWRHGEGQKYGPFDTRAQAERWATKQTAAARDVSPGQGSSIPEDGK